MIHSINSLLGCGIRATDGEIGMVKDVYFDDDGWAIRYLIVDTGRWIFGRKVLISLYSIRAARWADRTIDVALSRQQVKDSPDIDTDKPVSRQHEAACLGYYGYPVYWGGPLLWGDGHYPLLSPTAASRDEAIARQVRERELCEAALADARLRSNCEVHGYGVKAIDGAIGQVDDFLFDAESWAIRYVVVDTRDFWPGKHTILPSQWVERVEWSERALFLTAKRDAVRESPEYDPSAPLSQSYETDIQRRFAQRGVRTERRKGALPATSNA